MKSIRKPKIGLLLIGSPRFKSLGDGTRDGKYSGRKLIEADSELRDKLEALIRERAAGASFGEVEGDEDDFEIKDFDEEL